MNVSYVDIKSYVVALHDSYMEFIRPYRTPVLIRNNFLARFSKELVRVSGGRSLPFQRSGELKYDWR